MGNIGTKGRGQNMGSVIFWETKVEEDIVCELERILNEEKVAGRQFKKCVTVNGFQTNTMHDNETCKPILDTLLSYVPDGQNFYYIWFHLIDYDEQGKQLKHNHAATEDYSFIVYLTTCKEGGKTFFEVPNEPPFVSEPVRGKLLFFPSYLDHWGEEVIEHKKVAVGALKFIQPNA
jgi:hypothetical protein